MKRIIIAENKIIILNNSLIKKPWLVKKVLRYLDEYDVVEIIYRKENLITRIIKIILSVLFFTRLSKKEIAGFRKDKIKKFLDIYTLDIEIRLYKKDLKIKKIVDDYNYLSLSMFYKLFKSFSLIFKYYFNKKIVKDIINLKLGDILFKTFSLILVIVLSKILGPYEFGKYSVSLSLAMLFFTFISFGIPTAIIRYLSSKKYEYFSQLLFIYSLVSSLFLLLLISLYDKISVLFFKEKTNLVFISFFLAFILALYNIFKSVFVAFKRFDITRNFSFLEGLNKILFSIPLSIFFKSFGSLFGYVIAYSLNLLILFKNILKNYGFLFKNIKFRIEKEVIKYLLYLNLSTATISLYGWLDMLIISSLLNLRSVSFYRIANSVVQSVLMLSNIYGVFSPRIARWEIKEIKKKIVYIIILGYISSIFGFLMLNLFDEEIILYIFGKEYSASLPLIKVLSLLFFIQPLSIFNSVFNFKGKPEYTTISLSVLAITNAVLDYFLIKAYGLIGSVYATVIASILSAFTSIVLFRRFTRDF